MTIITMFSEASFALALILITIIVTAALLKGWSGWLALKRLELERPTSSVACKPGPDASAMTARIELAHLKERIRKLEAIAEGIDI